MSFRAVLGYMGFLLWLAIPALATPEDTTQTPPVASTIELRTYLDSPRVPLNRAVVFHVELSWIGDMSRYQITEIPQPVLTNLLLEGSGSSNRLEPLPDGRFRSTKSLTFQLKPIELGMAYIDGLVIKYRDTMTGETDALHSQRVMVEVIDPVPDGSMGGVWAAIYVVLLGIFAAAILYFGVLYFKRRKEARQARQPKVSLAEQYLKRLAQEVDPKGTNLNEMVVLLSKIFREYLAREFRIPAREASSEELYRHLSDAGVEENDLQRLRELFNKLDVIKFAGAEVDPAEFSLIYGTVEAFLVRRKKQWEAEQAQMKEV